MTIQPKPIPVEEMAEYLYADFEAGFLYWKKKPSAKVYVGDIAGRADRGGYNVVWFRNKKYLTHRVMWALANGDTEMRIDHLNGNRQDNRLANLREADTSVNTRNVNRVVGVWKEGRKWVVRRQIEAFGKQVLLGKFETKEEAEAFSLAQNEVYFPGVYAQRG